MFFSRKPILIYLQKNGFLLYSRNHPDGIEFKNPDTITPNTYSDALQTFIAENSLDTAATIIILSSDLITQKEIIGESSQDQQREVDAFISQSPIPSENQAKETFELDNKRFILIADKTSYQILASELQHLEWDIVSIVPISLFRDISDSKMKKNGLNQKEIQEIYTNTNLIKSANMLPAEDIPSQEGESEPSSFSSYFLNKTVMIAAVIILILGGSAYAYSQGTFSSLLASTATPKEEVTPTVQPTTTPTPAPTEEDKTKLSVQILNGTGTTGQAGKVKARLEKLDYSDIKTANGDTKENTITTVTFSVKVSREYQEEVTKDLEKMFEEVESEKSKEESPEFDIIILTGIEAK